MDKKIEITSDEFMEISAKITATDKQIQTLINHNPALLLFACSLIGKLARALFEEETDENGGEN